MTLQLVSECILLYDCDDAGLERTCREADEPISQSEICCGKPMADLNGTAATTTITTCMSWYGDDSDEDDWAFLTPEIARKRLQLVSRENVVNRLFRTGNRERFTVFSGMKIGNGRVMKLHGAERKRFDGRISGCKSSYFSNIVSGF
jgi:hypothetical protein